MAMLPISSAPLSNAIHSRRTHINNAASLDPRAISLIHITSPASIRLRCVNADAMTIRSEPPLALTCLASYEGVCFCCCGGFAGNESAGAGVEGRDDGGVGGWEGEEDEGEKVHL